MLAGLFFAQLGKIKGAVDAVATDGLGGEAGASPGLASFLSVFLVAQNLLRRDLARAQIHGLFGSENGLANCVNHAQSDVDGFECFASSGVNVFRVIF